MSGKQRGMTVGVVLLAVLALGGCSDSGDVGSPGFDPEQIENAALTVVDNVPAVEAAEGSIFGMVDEISGPAPLEFDPVGVPSHTEEFALDNGITGTVDSSTDGSFNFEFGGTIPVENGSVTIQGSMIVAPTATQPPSGAQFEIDYDVAASGPGGNASWGATGTVTVDASGQVTTFDLTFVQSVVAANGASATVTTRVDPASYEMTATGPFDNTSRFVVDRNSMTGVVYWNGQVIANLAVQGDCVDVDYVSEDYTDVSVCPQA